MADKLSTSALAKKRQQDAKQLFQDLKTAGYIHRHDEQWILTDLGTKFGGEYAQHPKYGRFIVWPENLLIDLHATSGQTLTATQVGEYFKLNPKKMNQLFSELGWIARSESGWHATESGLRARAQQREEKSSGNGFVVWHEASCVTATYANLSWNFSAKKHRLTRPINLIPAFARSLLPNTVL